MPSKYSQEIACKECGKKFRRNSKQPNKRFCSPECWNLVQSRSKLTILCQHCGAQKVISPVLVKQGAKFCSTECYVAHRFSTARDRFNQRFIKQTDNECWIWTGTAAGGGYGKMSIKGRSEKAHRLAWMFENGKIPDGLEILHRCDNPPCVNPAHLFLGTQTDNNNDMYAKGRAVHNPKKLTADQVNEMRNLDGSITRTELARRYNINVRTLRDILTKKLWKHLS